MCIVMLLAIWRNINVMKCVASNVKQLNKSTSNWSEKTLARLYDNARISQEIDFVASAIWSEIGASLEGKGMKA